MAKQNNSRCKAINSRGKRCGNDAKEGSEYCRIPSHNPSSPIKKGRWESFVAWINKHKNLIEIGILFVALLLAFNQTVQPVFFTRISSFEKTPLYLQSLVLNNNGTPAPNYYYIYKTTYIIEPAFASVFWFQKQREIDLPRNMELFTPGSGFWDDNPYVEFKLDHDPVLLDTEKNKSITLLIKPSGFTIKELPFTLYFRKPVELKCAENIDLPFEWNRFNIDIEHPPKIRCKHLDSPQYGLITVTPPDTLFEFRIMEISNEGDLDIKGLLINFPTKDTVSLVCSEKDDVPKLNRNTVSLNMKSGEKKRLVVINRFSDEEFERNKHLATFNFTRVRCDSDWNEYVK